MFETTSDTTRVTLSGRAYWNEEPQGFSVRLSGNADVSAVLYIPLCPPELGSLLKDIGGRLYKNLSGSERLLLGQNVNAAIRHRLAGEGPKLHLMGRAETRYLEEAQSCHAGHH